MHDVDTYFNKRNILNRMKKLAVSGFRIKDASGLDPFVSLFLESLSEEIYKIVGDIEKMEGRILEKVSDMLISDISLYPIPSDSILHATPVEPVCKITKDMSFTFEKSSAKKDTKITFHPVCNTRIIKGDIRYIIVNGLCYSVDNDQTNSLLSRSRQNAEWQSFWIGIDLDESIESLKELSFYLNFSDIDEKEEYQKLLLYFDWKFKSSTLTLRRGLSIQEDTINNSTIELFNTLNYDYQICKSILEKCENKYFTIDDDISISDVDKTCFPEELSSYFPAQFVSTCTQPLIWIEVEYPDTIKPEILSSLQVSINTFPVINKLQKSLVVDLKQINPVIPILTKENECFLSIQSVTDEAAHKYHELPFLEKGLKSYRTYSLRRGGYEKYNSRDAREYLINVYNLLDKYTLSLNEDDTEGDDNFEGIQSCLSELVRYLKDTIAHKTQPNEQKTYLQIDDVGDEKILFIKYWITNAETGNNLKQGIILDNNSDEALVPSSLVLLTGASNGKNSPLSDERKNIYQESMEKSSLIITNEDIREFCQEELGTILESVSINKGLMVDPCHIDRFIQTTDIHLIMDKKFTSLLKEQDQKVFTQKIKKRSPATYNYRIFIN